jgi:2-polyprenyl-6-methoxyphenol hydroxylase-like FAD-dependent oxidoreductase
VTVPAVHSVLIVGGGFSGLSAATTLARRGATVDLVERNEAWTVDGAGISIGGATLRALDALGVLDEFFAQGYGCDGTDVRSPDGTLLDTFPTPRLVSDDVPGNGAILRPRLHRILVNAAAAAGVTMRLGTTVEKLTDDGDDVEVVLSDGATRDYDLVVAADGLFSPMRATLFPEASAPRYSGQGAWRAVVPRPADVERTTLWVGQASKVGVNPISHDEMYLFVNENRPERDHIDEAEWLPTLRILTEPFTDPIVHAARASLGEESLMLYRPMDNLLLRRPWHSGHVVFIGDAVHATTPHLAAGAGLGIEDALVLADEIGDASDVETALTTFEQRRWERCRMVVENSERLGVFESTPGGEDSYIHLQAESFRLLSLPI